MSDGISGMRTIFVSHDCEYLLGLAWAGGFRDRNAILGINDRDMINIGFTKEEVTLWKSCIGVAKNTEDDDDDMERFRSPKSYPKESYPSYSPSSPCSSDYRSPTSPSSYGEEQPGYSPSVPSYFPPSWSYSPSFEIDIDIEDEDEDVRSSEEDDGLLPSNDNAIVCCCDSGSCQCNPIVIA